MAPIRRRDRRRAPSLEAMRRKLVSQASGRRGAWQSMAPGGVGVLLARRRHGHGVIGAIFSAGSALCVRM